MFTWWAHCDSNRLNSFRFDWIRLKLTHSTGFDSIPLNTFWFDSIRLKLTQFDLIWLDSTQFDSIRFDSTRFDSIRLKCAQKAKCDSFILLRGQGSQDFESCFYNFFYIFFFQIAKWGSCSAPRMLIVRFLGTTPTSSTIPTMLLSICQQICYNMEVSSILTSLDIC